MAFKDLMGKTESPEAGRPAAPVAPQPSRPPAASGSSTTFLDASTVFSGKLHCSDSLRIDGQVKGEIRCEQKVAIGETGVVHASIDADTVVIAGEVKGDISAARKITLEKTARVMGDLSTPGIVIQEGAKLEGRITIGEEQGAKEAQKPAPSPPEKQPAAKTAPPPAAGPPPPAGS
jgi:cytoskeletal protein CcmA (bactofilin family)